MRHIIGKDPALSEFFDGCPMPAFAIDTNHVVTQWNKACEHASGIAAADMIGTRNQWRPFYKEQRPVLADLVVDGSIEHLVGVHYNGDVNFRRSPINPHAYEAESFFEDLNDGGKWLAFSAAPLRDAAGIVIGAIEILQDITQRKIAEAGLHKVQQDLEQLVVRRTGQLAEANRNLEEDIRQRAVIEIELKRRNAELTSLNEKFSLAQQQLMQSEKLASIGQLAAGVAHEINNPIAYIFSNFGTLETYIGTMLSILGVYEEAEKFLPPGEMATTIKQTRELVELDFLKQDIHALMAESREGILRVRKIVQDLKDFSRVDTSQEWQYIDLHSGIDSTLNVVNSEIKYKADVIREYGCLPEVECLPSQINQVILNLIVNAAHAIENKHGTIVIKTKAADDYVSVEVIDNGKGIEEKNLHRIFDPFFTTKPIGQGTGLGLSLSYGIVKKHGGSLTVKSELGTGTTFCISLPVHHHQVLDPAVSK